MKISEIRQIPAAELSQRIADEVANYNQLVLNPACNVSWPHGLLRFDDR